jgi:osmoprotectant transport system permease protein
MMRIVAIIVCLIAFAAWPRGGAERGIRVGSKKFTESVILGEALVQLLRASGDEATHVSELGGTQIVFDALVRGEIDLYPEYTGTLRQEIFARTEAETVDELNRLLGQAGVVMSRPLGFSNSYALAARRDVAQRFGLAKISDLARHPDVRLGLSNEFLDRGDGWRNLRSRYVLPQDDVPGLDHDLAYRQLESGVIDVVDVYTTDARLADLDLVILEDDRDYFPAYDAVVLSRADLADRHPNAPEQIAMLEGAINEPVMIALNARVESGAVNESQAASEFLRDSLDIETTADVESTALSIWRRTLEHIDLVRRSLGPAILVAVPLGVAAAKRPRLGQAILGVVGIVQTIPALALLVLLIPAVAWLGLETLGAGSATAVLALFLYSLLPIVRNTATGIAGIAPEHRESAAALGLPPAFRLFNIELPLASLSILAGIKTAAVLNVGFATLGALVGARGYGQPILTGIRLNNMSLIMQGAIPAACLALLIQLLFEVAERWLVPAGLRGSSQRTSSE